jgi:hypothetical protein
LRGPTGTVITLTLSDYFKITLDDVVVFRESFANAIDTVMGHRQHSRDRALAAGVFCEHQAAL